MGNRGDVEEDEDGEGSSVGLLVTCVDVRSLDCTMSLTSELQIDSPRDLGARLRVEATGVGLRHISCAPDAECEPREELCFHVASACVLGSAQVRLAGEQPAYSSLLQLGIGSDDTRSWARDVAKAVEIMTSEAAPEVKAHLLAPLVNSRWPIESCFVGCGWDCLKQTFTYPLSDSSRLRKAQELLSDVTRAPLVATLRWHSSSAFAQPCRSALLDAAPSTPTHSTTRHSLGYAGMGAWLERLLRATALGAGAAGDARNSSGSAGDRSSFGGAADRSSLGANSVHGSMGLGGVWDAGEMDKLEVDVWCGPLSLMGAVNPVLALSAALAEHAQPLAALFSRPVHEEWDADDADSFASCASPRAGGREADAWPPRTSPSIAKPMLATRVRRVCAHRLRVDARLPLFWCS